MTPPRTLYQKLWDDHCIEDYGDGQGLLWVDRQLLYEATSFQAFLALNNANDLYLKGKYAESVDAYKKAIATTFHDSEQAYFELGQALMATNDVASARLAFMQALNINNGYTAAAVALDAINRPVGPR